jgi:hypothetical protein
MTIPACACGSQSGLTLIGIASTDEGRVRLFTCPPCREQARQVEQQRQRCIGFQCSERFVPNETGRGRPALYCGENCRKATDRAITSAIRSTVRNVVPSSVPDLEAVIARVEFLRCCWGGPRAEVEHGRKFPTVPSPIPSLARASAGYLTALSQSLASRREAERAQRSEAFEQSQLDARRTVLAGRAAEDQAWRAKVLAEIDGVA